MIDFISTENETPGSRGFALQDIICDEDANDDDNDVTIMFSSHKRSLITGLE